MSLSDVTAQEEQQSNDNIVFGANPEVHPEYPGGYLQFYCFIDSLMNKEIINNSKIEGTTFVQFTINTLGVVKNVEILKGNNKALNKELIRVISMSPKWEPGGYQLDNKFIPKDILYTLPVKIPYESKCKK